MKLRFVSCNGNKMREVTHHLAEGGVEVRPVAVKLQELQSPDLDAIVQDKCLKAFGIVGHPVIVEHTSLHLDSLNGLPGGLTQLFWDGLQAERFTELFGRQATVKSAKAVTAVGYCDGLRIHVFKGELRGTIAPEVSGPRDFGWDCVFIPEGHSRTLAEIGHVKRDVSMRAIALDGLLQHLRS